MDDVNRCVMCGEIIPEGTQVCSACYRRANKVRAYTFVVYGEPKTKKNSSQIVINPKTHRPFITPSKSYKDWCRVVTKQLAVRPDRPREPIDYPVQVSYRFYMPTRRMVDDLNLSAAMDDILVQAGILLDDNRDIVAYHDGTRVYYDKENPRVEIRITEVYGWERWKNAKEK